MLSFLPCELKLTSKPLSLPTAVDMLAAAKEGEWINNPTDAKAWSPRAAAAIEHARQSLHDVLATGGITAYVHIEAVGAFRVVPVAYWQGSGRPIRRYQGEHDEHGVTSREDGLRDDRLGERTFAFDTRLPPDVADCPILVLEEDVRTLLKQARGPSGRGPKPIFDALAFQDEAVRRIWENGGFSEGWLKAQLHIEMEEWCDGHWERTPERTWIQDHIKKAEVRFKAEKAAI